MALNKLFIFPKDIQAITGMSERYGQKVIADIKKKLGKQKHQFVTVLEFCEHMGITLQHVRACLREP